MNFQQCCGGGSVNKKYKYAILLLDFQNEFAKPGGKLHKKVSFVMERTGMLDKVRQVVDAARETDALIIHSPVIMKANELFQEADFDSQNYSKQYGLFTEGTWNAEFVEETKPNEDEIVLSGRNDFNAFKGTELTQLLQENNIETLYIMGFLTNVCVEDTVIAATELLPHLRVVVLTDGCAALTMKEHNLTINASLPVLCDTTSCAEFIYSGEEMPPCCKIS
mmetsp:Transcript_44129/g.50005  ORF Transcript_44129/g.50005 Transcript_44129/m.50005 type:complete len:222 (+) Transcript_44129:127-792(+)